MIDNNTEFEAFGENNLRSQNLIWPNRIDLSVLDGYRVSSTFRLCWTELMKESCHEHSVWHDRFSSTLHSAKHDVKTQFDLASAWSINMVVGSYCFPRYVSALAARAESDAVRYGLVENAWDESGSHGHTSRSHFWLAVRLARLLRLSDSQIERIVPLREAQNYTDEHYKQCASGDFEFALGMICLIEEFTTPEFTMIFKSFLRSCEVGLGMKPEDFILRGGAEYFTANIADDERHREEMPRLVSILLQSKGVDMNDSQGIDKALSRVKAGSMYSAALRKVFF